MSSVKEQARKLVETLGDEASWDDLLEQFKAARRLTDLKLVVPGSRLPRGATREQLQSLAGTLDPESAREMREAIEEGCERVNPDAW
jgi:hypothetical protein